MQNAKCERNQSGRNCRNFAPGRSSAPQSASRSRSLTVQSCNSRSGFPDARTIAPAARLDDGAPFHVDFDGEHVANLLTAPEPEATRSGTLLASTGRHSWPRSDAGRALRPELCAIRELHQLPDDRRRRWILTWFLDQHRPQRRRCPCEAAVRHAKAAMPILHQPEHRLHRSSLHRERRLRRLPHDDSVRRLHGHTLVSNRLNEVDHRSDLRCVNRAGVRNQEHPHRSPEVAVAQVRRQIASRAPPDQFVGAAPRPRSSARRIACSIVKMIM